MRQKKLLRALLCAMSQPWTFYVLGAGASYGLLPVTQKMKRFIEDEYHNIGVYLTSPAPHTPLFKRVIGHIQESETNIRTLLLRHMPLSTLDFLTQRALWTPIQKVAPPQYRVFEMFGSPSTLFNFNLDGLAYVYCRNCHIVLEPHGRIDNAWLEHCNYNFSKILSCMNFRSLI